MNGIISESGGGRSLSANSTQQKVAASFAQKLNCTISDVSAWILISDIDSGH
jgi:hypothetical protein